MDLFNEIDDLGDLFLLEKNTKLDSAIEGYEDLQSKYSSLHEDYAKEIENSKKVEKCLIKCLKFYSKLSKKYETQQKLISNLEQTVKEKIVSLEEAQRNEEKLRGLIQVYRTERAFYAGQTNSDLRKDKEILLDICCRLIGESVRNNNIKSLTNLLLRKFKKDLDEEKVNLLKRNLKLKNEFGWEASGDVKSDFSVKSEEVKTEKNYSEDPSEACVTKDEDEDEPKNSPLDLSLCIRPTGAASQPVDESSQETPDENSQVAVMSEDESEYESSLPALEEVSPAKEPPGTAAEETGGVVDKITEGNGKTVDGPNPQSEEEDSVGEVLQEGSTTTARLEEEAPFDSTERKSTGAVAIGFKSIFDISDGCLKASDSKSDSGVRENADVSEIKFGYLFEEKERWDPPRLESVGRVDLRSPVKEEEELLRMLREMTSMRLPAPVVEIIDALEKAEGDAGNGSGVSSAKQEQSQKRNLTVEENCWKSKKSKSEEEGRGEGGGGQSGGLLDSIMSAMSLQNKEFKTVGGECEGSGETVSREEGSRFSSLGRRTYSRRKKSNSGSLKENSSESRQSPGKKQNRQQTLESLVMEEIKNFVGSPMSCKEEADKQVKQCVSVLSGKPEEMIVKCVVAMVLENVDEVVEVFERPAPPLTKTQHRLIVLLSVFRTIDSSFESFEKISTGILSMISEKLFPDNFFWPDDSLEAATRFYAALCRARNDPKTLWRFCLRAMTDMRQRCPLLVFTVLKTWPDVLYDAATLKNNFLALTIVNIFLHMPKTEGLRNGNQSRKLVALKHLLMNFYQFKIEDTIEGHAKKVLAAFRREEPGTGKSVVLLCKCRDAGWSVKNVVPALRSTLDEWAEGKVEDRVGRRVLCVAKEICGVLLQEGTHGGKVKELVHCLSAILSSGKKSHDSEVDLIEVLLQLKQYPEARKIIREWIPKAPIEDRLRNEIINASAENILRELKLNKRKEAKGQFSRRKIKKQPKKLKGNKKKGKIRKRERRKAGSVGVSS